jgi:hypothetical protein
MKKIFTLIAGLFMAAVVFAADHNPDLTIRNSRNFKIVIDGRSFYSNNAFLRINNMPRGQHRIEVFEMRRGFFGQRETLVNRSTFRMGKQDVRINIDYNGSIIVMNDRDRYGRDNDWGWDRSGRDQRSYDHRDYGRNDNNYGRDNQYGHDEDDRGYGQRNDRSSDRKNDDNRRY